MGKVGWIVLAVAAWCGVLVAVNFHQIVPNASEEEIRPFLIGAVVLALVVSGVAISKAMGASKAQPPGLF